MFGQIRGSLEQDQDAAYSSTAWLANFGLNCTKNFVNTYQFVSATCSKVYDTSKKVVLATVTFTNDVVVASYPGCKALAYCLVSEAITMGFPEQYHITALSGIGALAYSLMPNPQLYQSMVIERNAWKSASQIIPVPILMIYGAQQIARARFQYTYPLGYIEGLGPKTQVVYDLVAGCEKATELWFQAGEFAIRPEYTGETTWIRLEKTISLNVKVHHLEAFKEFIHALSDAVHDKEINRVWEDLDQGKLSEDEFATQFKVFWKSEKKAINVVNACAREYHLITKMNPKEQNYLDIDPKENLDNLDGVVQHGPAKKRRAYIKKEWRKRGYVPFCGKHPFHNDCVSAIHFQKGRVLDMMVHDLKVPTCSKKKVAPVSLGVELINVKASPEIRIQALIAGAFREVPELGRLVGFCDSAYQAWIDFETTQTKEPIITAEGINDHTPTQELYNLFSRFIRRVQDQLLVTKLEELDKRNARGLLYKDRQYIKQVLMAEWKTERGYLKINQECMKIFNSNSPKKFHLSVKSFIPKWDVFEKFAEHRLIKEQAPLEQKWREGRWPYCEKHPSEEGCTNINNLGNAIINQKIRDLTISTCSENAFR